MKTHTNASLRIYSSSLSAEELKAQIGVEPSSALPKGTRVNPRNTRSHLSEFSFWILDSPLPPEAPLVDHIGVLLNAVEKTSKELRSLVQSGCTIDILCSYGSSNPRTPLDLTPQILSRLAAVPLALLLTVSYMGNGDEDQPADPRD